MPAFSLYTAKEKRAALFVDIHCVSYRQKRESPVSVPGCVSFIRLQEYRLFTSGAITLLHNYLLPGSKRFRAIDIGLRCTRLLIYLNIFI